MTDAQRHANQAALLRRMIAEGKLKGSNRDDSGNTVDLLIANLERSANR